MKTKEYWRIEMKSRIKSIEAENHQRLQDQLFNFLQSHLADSKILGAYQPLKDEPQVNWQQLTKFRLAYPQVQVQPVMHYYIDNKQVKPQAAVVPGLAFNSQGYRLGRGGGYFDCYLAQNKEVKSVAVAFESQIQEDFPVEKHDQKVNFLITEKNIFRFEQE